MWISCQKSILNKNTYVYFKQNYSFFEQRAVKHIFAFVLMQMSACLKEHKSVDYVSHSLHGLPGQRCYLESSRLQQAQHARSAKHFVSWDLSVYNCSGTNVVFQTAILLILVARNNKRSSGIDGKTSDCLSRTCLYYRYLKLRFWQELSPESSEPVIFLFSLISSCQERCL